METQVLDSLRYCRAREEAGPRGSNLRKVAATCASFEARAAAKRSRKPVFFASFARTRSVNVSCLRRATMR